MKIHNMTNYIHKTLIEIIRDVVIILTVMVKAAIEIKDSDATPQVTKSSKKNSVDSILYGQKGQNVHKNFIW